MCRYAWLPALPHIPTFRSFYYRRLMLYGILIHTKPGRPAKVYRILLSCNDHMLLCIHSAFGRIVGRYIIMQSHNWRAKHNRGNGLNKMRWKQKGLVLDIVVCHANSQKKSISTRILVCEERRTTWTHQKNGCWGWDQPPLYMLTWCWLGFPSGYPLPPFAGYP